MVVQQSQAQFPAAAQFYPHMMAASRLPPTPAMTYAGGPYGNGIPNEEYLKMRFHINPEAHGFATPPPSVLPRTIDGKMVDGTPFLTPPSAGGYHHVANGNTPFGSSLMGCQQVTHLEQHALHSPVMTPPETANDHRNPFEAQLEAQKLQNGTTNEANAQSATAMLQQVLHAAALSSQMGANNGTAPNIAALALQQLIAQHQTPGQPPNSAINPMLFAALSQQGGGAYGEALPALLALLNPALAGNQQMTPQALQAAFVRNAYQQQHDQQNRMAIMQHLMAAHIAQQHQQQQQFSPGAAQRAAANAATATVITAKSQQKSLFSPTQNVPSQAQWMSPPLTHTPASSASPLYGGSDDANDSHLGSGSRDERRSTSAVTYPSAQPSPQPRGDMISPPQHRAAYFRKTAEEADMMSAAEKMDVDYDEFGRTIAKHSGLSEQEGIAVAVLAGLASARRA